MNFSNNRPFNKGGFKPKTIKDFTGSKPNRHGNSNTVGFNMISMLKDNVILNRTNRFRTSEQIESDLEILRNTPPVIMGLNENWKHLTLGYYIHPKSLIFCADSKKLIEQYPRDKKNNPYLVVTLSYKGEGEIHYVHRLTAFAFCEYPKGVDPVELYYNPEKWKVHHINTKKTDNRAENLMWLDSSDHAKLHQDLKNKKVSLKDVNTPEKIRAYINANYR